MLRGYGGYGGCEGVHESLRGGVHRRIRFLIYPISITEMDRCAQLTDRSRAVPCPIILPHSALVFARTDDLGACHSQREHTPKSTAAHAP